MKLATSEVIASRPASRRLSPSSPIASVASGASAPVYAITTSAFGPGLRGQQAQSAVSA